MTRLLQALSAAFVALALAAPAAAQSVVGTWTTSQRSGSPNDTYSVMQLAPDGRIATQTTNISPAQGIDPNTGQPYASTRGMGFQMFGVYRFDQASGTFQYQWTDYTPKQVCAGYCTPQPPAFPLGTTVTNRIRFLNANEFVATLPDGSAATVWVRGNVGGFPIQ